jgi:hypothetical protein
MKKILPLLLAGLVRRVHGARTIRRRVAAMKRRGVAGVGGGCCSLHKSTLDSFGRRRRRDDIFTKLKIIRNRSR